MVYLFTGIILDWLGGRPPRFETAAGEHWRAGFVEGAIYGALFMGSILVAALILRAPGAEMILDRAALLIGPIGGALAFPLAQTIMGSANGTAPFFGRLKRASLDPRGPARGIVAGLGLALAYRAGLAAYDGGVRFLAMAVVGALCYGGVDLIFDAGGVFRANGGSCKAGAFTRWVSSSAALVAGALGWYFDAAQLQVVVGKFWAYADVNYRLDGRRLGDFTDLSDFQQIRDDQPR